MNFLNKISLSEAQETLLIPLYAKAQKNPVMEDEWARQILKRISYDFSRLKIPQKTEVTLRLRAKQFDRYTSAFLQKHPTALILHLGCGLDSRCMRVKHSQAVWIDLDMPDVIALRRKFFEEDEVNRMIASSVTDLQWLEQVQNQGRPVLLLAEGLLMYLYEEDVRELFLAIRQKFPGADIIFDVFSLYTVSQINKHPSLQKTGAEIRWGIDDPHIIESWAEGIHLKEDWYFSQSPDIQFLNWFYRLMFKLTASIKIVRLSQRLLYYRL